MGDNQDDTGWRPPVYFALGAVAALTIAWTWPEVDSICPVGEQNEVVRCAREWIGALSGWVAAIAAGATLFYFKRQNDLAGASLKTANDTLDETRQSNERQLRAYINTEKPIIENFNTSNGKCVVTVRNSGQTPAHNIMVGATIFVADEIEDTSIPPETDFGVLGPGQTAFIKRGVIIPDEHRQTIADRLASGEIWIWVVGTITYTDVFGQTRETKFKYQCSRINGTSDPMMKSANSGNTST